MDTNLIAVLLNDPTLNFEEAEKIAALVEPGIRRRAKPSHEPRPSQRPRPLPRIWRRTPLRISSR